MKKIRSHVNPKDRIVCVTATAAHHFYFISCKSDERLYLFTTKAFSGSVFAYFRDHGVYKDDGFSLTLKELYEDHKVYRNPKLRKIFDRLPGAIDYIIREKQVRHPERSKRSKVVNNDRELAA